MSVMPLNELFQDHKRPLPLHVDQYHAMIQSGIVEGAPYELLP